MQTFKILGLETSEKSYINVILRSACLANAVGQEATKNLCFSLKNKKEILLPTSRDQNDNRQPIFQMSRLVN